jgi:hypothetical protein
MVPVLSVALRFFHHRTLRFSENAERLAERLAEHLVASAPWWTAKLVLC